MNWQGPTYTDSGGFQVLSLGVGYSKVLTEEFSSDGAATKKQANRAVRLARKIIDDDGVTLPVILMDPNIVLPVKFQ